MAAIHLPRTIRLGGGVLNDLPEVLAAAGLARPLIVTDPWMQSSGLLERVEQLLAAAGITARSFTGVVPDPTVTSIEDACAFLAGGSHDCVIGLGGGSPIDSAKMVAVRRDRSVQALKSPHQEDAPGLPVIAIPTTAGTGSEATRFTVITDAETDEKMLCAGLARPLIVTDAWMQSSGLLERVEQLLAAAGITARSFTGVVPDPTVTSIEDACAFLAG